MRAVPNNSLLWAFLVAGVPATTLLVYAEGGGRIAAAALLLALLATALADLAWSRRILDRIEVRAADLVRGTKGRRFEFALEFLNHGPRLSKLRSGLALSPYFRFEGGAERRIPSLEAEKVTRLAFPLVPLKRGRHSIDSAHLETPSHLGLWLMRRAYPLATEFRIYPDLSPERRRLAGRFLLRGQAGQRLVRQVGKGRDFEQLREYQPGDDYVDIDWKATARRLSPMTRTYQIERTQEIYVVVDHSRLSGREIRVEFEEEALEDWGYSEDSLGGGALVTTQLEKFLHCALILASVAERQGDRFGFVSYADRVGRFLRAGSGRGHFNLVRDTLYTLEPKRVAPDFEELMVALRQRLNRRALIVMLVDLSDPLTAEQFHALLPLISRQHLVLVNMVRPPEARPLFSGHADPEDPTEIYERLAGHFQWQELRDLGRKLDRLGVSLGLPEHADICVDTVTQYLNVKHRQML